MYRCIVTTTKCRNVPLRENPNMRISFSFCWPDLTAPNVIDYTLCEWYIFMAKFERPRAQVLSSNFFLTDFIRKLFIYNFEPQSRTNIYSVFTDWNTHCEGHFNVLYKVSYKLQMTLILDYQKILFVLLLTLIYINIIHLYTLLFNDSLFRYSNCTNFSP